MSDPEKKRSSSVPGCAILALFGMGVVSALLGTGGFLVGLNNHQVRSELLAVKPTLYASTVLIVIAAVIFGWLLDFSFKKP